MNLYRNISASPNSFQTEASSCCFDKFQQTDYQHIFKPQNITPFTDKELDSETGYSYFGARYYDAELSGLFFSMDPMADKYPSISLYNYCLWNPIKLRDPDGNIPILIPLIIGAIEIGTAIYDAVDAGKTILNKDATTTAKWAAVGCLALDIALPGGGYGVAYKMTSKTVFKIAGRECRTASEF